MKKLLAVALVLGLASIANAAFVIEGPHELQFGEVGTYTVSLTDTNVNILDALAEVANGPATFGAVTIVASPRDTTLDIVSGGSFALAASGATAGLAGPLAQFTVTAGDVLGIATLHVMATELNGGSYNVPNFELVFPEAAFMPVNIVPEPMTMSLLALGGLGLLRRRG